MNPQKTSHYGQTADAQPTRYPVGMPSDGKPKRIPLKERIILIVIAIVVIVVAFKLSR